MTTVEEVLCEQGLARAEALPYVLVTCVSSPHHLQSPNLPRFSLPQGLTDIGFGFAEMISLRIVNAEFLDLFEYFPRMDEFSRQLFIADTAGKAHDGFNNDLAISVFIEILNQRRVDFQVIEVEHKDVLEV